MPELPDVQVFKEYVDATSLHQAIVGLKIDAPRLLEGVSARTLESRLTGRTLASTRRHGKHLFAEVVGRAGPEARAGWLRLHFGMTGSLAYYQNGYEDGAEAPDHTRLRLDFPGAYHLVYVNVRRLGAIGWVVDVDTFIAEQGLGPDALDIDPETFARALHGRRGTIKSALMNQAVLAGIGNVYADEILFRAGFDPTAPVDALGKATLRRLHEAMAEVLHAAIDARVERFPAWFMLPHRDGDQRCPHCGGRLQKTKVSGRTTWSCPRKQKRRR